MATDHPAPIQMGEDLSIFENLVTLLQLIKELTVLHQDYTDPLRSVLISRISDLQRSIKDKLDLPHTVVLEESSLLYTLTHLQRHQLRSNVPLLLGFRPILGVSIPSHLSCTVVRKIADKIRELDELEFRSDPFLDQMATIDDLFLLIPEFTTFLSENFPFFLSREYDSKLLTPFACLRTKDPAIIAAGFYCTTRFWKSGMA